MRKSRKTTPKRRTRRTVRKQSINPILIGDIIGIGLILLCFVMYYALFRGESSGLMGPYVAAALKTTLGVGAWWVPFLIALLGAIMIVGPAEIIPRNVGLGSTILFVVIITWAGVLAFARGDLTLASHGGGVVGNYLAYLLRSAVGVTPAYFVLAGLAAVGVIVIVDVPISSMVARARDAHTAWQEAAQERRALGADKRAKNAAAKPKDSEIVKESRKRTLASIFNRGDAEIEEEEKPVATPAPRPQIKFGDPLLLKPEKAPGNGGAVQEPVQQGEFQLPPTTLLVEPPPPPQRVESELRENIEIIERTLAEFKIEANVVEIAHGPTVARYEIRLAPGIKVQKIVNLADNLAMSLSAIDVRVEAPIPGKAAIGVEVPNKNKGIVVLRELVESKPFREAGSKLVFALGKDVSGRPMVADLARMPHMLIGGATNAGKSVGLNTLIGSLLFRATPDELKLVLIDPKRVELSLFDGIPHLACPVVKSAKQAAGTFRAVVQEMERRYDMFARTATRNIDGYNEKVSPEERLPFMVVVVDELCDLMMQAAAEVEGSITRLAQLARATGIHLVIATQRPSVDVITGVIKANISSRIAFACSSWHDSKTILDQKGAERLIGRGDMLFLPIDASKPVRIQGCYMSEKEIEALCNFLKEQRKPSYTLQATAIGEGSAGGGASGEDDDMLADEFYEPSVRFIVNTGYCSTSMLQRKFKIGYTRAARIVDVMEQQGIVGPLDGAGTKGRQVLVTKADLEQAAGGRLGMAPDSYDDDEDVPPAEIIEPDSEEE